MLFSDEYQTISEASKGEFKDRGSLFLALAFPVISEEQVKELMTTVKKEHPKANHHCYAFSLGPGGQANRFSDDREPSGTAGKPIMGVIRSNELTDILIVVVRYFGGSLLGVPGLINAYKTAALASVNNAVKITKTITERYRILFPFELSGELESLIRKSDAAIDQWISSHEGHLIVSVPRSGANMFLNSLRTHHLLNEKCTIELI